MKINMYSTPMDGRCGIGTYTKILTEEMRKQRPDYEIKNVFVDRYTKNAFHFLKNAFKISKDCDIAHIQFEYDFFGKFPITGIYIPLFYTIVKLLSYLYSFKIVTTMHNTWEVKNPPKMGKLGTIYTYVINKFVTGLSGGIIALSRTIEDRLIEQNVPNNKIFQVPHGMEEPIFLDKDECKKKIGVDPDKKLITIFGYVRLDDGVDVKGHDLFIKAASSLDNNMVFLVAGDGQTEREKEYLEELKKKSDEKVIFYGFVEDDEISVILNATDVMVLPYRKITVSGILNWSLAYRIPTITSDLRYFKGINDKYECLYIIEKDYAEKLAKGIKYFVNDETLKERLKQNSMRYYEENNYKMVVKKTFQTYNNILGGE